MMLYYIQNLKKTSATKLKHYKIFRRFPNTHTHTHRKYKGKSIATSKQQQQ